MTLIGLGLVIFVAVSLALACVRVVSPFLPSFTRKSDLAMFGVKVSGKRETDEQIEAQLLEVERMIEANEEHMRRRREIYSRLVAAGKIAPRSPRLSPFIVRPNADVSAPSSETDDEPTEPRH